MTSFTIDRLLDVEPWLAVRAAFLSASMIILLVNTVPCLRTRLLSYGSRLTSPKTPSRETTLSKPSAFIAFLDRIAAYRVPHSYFIHFYVVSTVGSFVWIHQILSRGILFKTLAARTSSIEPAMSREQTALVWALMFVQGSRRLYECLVFSRPSQSQMWVGHWIMGLLFYIGMPIAVWIEGISALDNDLQSWTFSQRANVISPGDLVAMLPAPTFRTIVFTILFLFASGLQYDTHFYLYSLPKPSSSTERYSVPQHPNFSLCLTPHYFFEILVYVSLAFLSAPKGQLLNGTVTCGLLFVMVNLGVTAQGTEVYWRQTWGERSIQGRAKMIPWIW